MNELEERLLIHPDGSPKDRIVGFETEYALQGVWESGAQMHDSDVCLFASKALGGINKQFAADGSRRYVDVGNHPEYATAEETSFLGSAYRLLHGHVRMSKIYAEYAADKPEIKHMILMANTTDAAWNSWASHENLLTRRAVIPDDILPAFAAHNLSRIAWSGAGHVIPKAGDGYQFTLSEKAEFIWEYESLNTVSSRPLVNTRDEPLANEHLYRRLHCITGESVVSPFVNAMRLATGSILLRACELGVDFSDLAPHPDSVRGDILTISHDPDLKATIELENGKKYNALGLQRALAEKAICATMKVDYLTEQEKEWGEKWIKLCDDLAQDPRNCIKQLDWPIKRELILREVEAKRGSGKSEFEVAQAKSFLYHQLLPTEGKGMEILRKGFFEYSPDAETLESGLPLPQTRAKLRGEAIYTLRKAGIEFAAVWEKVGLLGGYTVQLLDPYNTNDERLECLVKYALDHKDDPKESVLEDKFVAHGPTLSDVQDILSEL
jgi:proteasome accessory factor A